MILLLNAAIPKLVYGSTTITNAVFKIDTKEDALVYNLVGMTFKTVNSIAFYLHYWKGAKQYGLLYLAVKRCKGCRKMLSGTLKASAGNNELRLDPTKLLNYESWVDADNLVRFGTKESMPIILN
jgi:hypothetical protein